MKPKNLKERRGRFLKFILLFLLTVATIMALVFFNFRVPKKENSLLKAQAKSIKKETEFQNGFSKKMKTLRNMIDSLDVPGQNISFQKSLINSNLADLQKTIPTKDSTYKYDMYIGIVKLYSDLVQSKDKLRDLKEAESTIAEYKDELESCRKTLTDSERNLYAARASAR